MDLLHVDFTSIEMTLELKRLPEVANVLVFQDHFTKHVMAYVTPNQTTKTVTKFLYEGYIFIFRAPARLLHDQGANFMSSITDKMCKLLGMRKLHTMPYHPLTNGLVERSHQTIMWMIRNLGEDKQANRPGHLAKIVHTYNATQSAMVGCSPHYLMFWCRQSSESTFTSPPLGAQKSAWEVHPLSMWTNTWLLSMTDWGPLCVKLRPSQWKKPSDRNGTMAEK